MDIVVFQETCDSACDLAFKIIKDTSAALSCPMSCLTALTYGTMISDMYSNIVSSVDQ